MAVTLKFLSEKANLSTTTVSLILNGKNVRVSEAKKKRVLQLAKEYNYIPNSLAVGLVTKKTKTIGLIIPDISNIFFAEIAKNCDPESESKSKKKVSRNARAGEGKRENIQTITTNNKQTNKNYKAQRMLIKDMKKSTL